MSALFDTNVIVDVLLAREPFAADSNACFLQVEDGLLHGFLGATTVTTIDYLVAGSLGQRASRQHLGRLLELFDVAPVNRAVLGNALKSPQKDFEDAVLAEAARACGAGAIITRNAKDFASCGLPIYTPREWLASQGG